MAGVTVLAELGNGLVLYKSKEAPARAPLVGSAWREKREWLVAPSPWVDTKIWVAQRSGAKMVPGQIKKTTTRVTVQHRPFNFEPYPNGCGSKPMGSDFGVAPPILEPILGGVWAFDPWPNFAVGRRN